MCFNLTRDLSRVKHIDASNSRSDAPITGIDASNAHLRGTLLTLPDLRAILSEGNDASESNFRAFANSGPSAIGVSP